jgi:hypothetical protein
MTRQMLTPGLSIVGLGFAIFEIDGWTRFDHPGWNEGYHSYLAGFLGKGQGLVWMTNGENGKLLGMEVMRGLAKVRGWPGFKPREKSVVQVAASRLSRFEGKFHYVDYPEYGVEVFKDGENLSLRELPIGTCYPLYPETDTDFFSIENPEQVSFIDVDGGEVNRMQIGRFEQLERTAS